MPRWFIRPQTVTYPSTNPAVHGQESNMQPVDYSPTPSPLQQQATLNWQTFGYKFMNAPKLYLLKHDH